MPTVVLIAASGAAWESALLSLLEAEPDVVVLKRCVDVDDLLATAAAEQADAAVVALDSPGLDGSAVELLARHRVAPVAVVSGLDGPAYDAARLRASRLGIARMVSAAELTRVPALLLSGDEPTPTVARGGPAPEPSRGRIIAVWGPGGAPGRTTVAGGIAAELASRGVPTCLVDADPHTPSLAQFWGILDEVSGLLAAARLAGSGVLGERVASVQRQVAPYLSVVTGLPRPDRYVEVRAGAVEHVLESAAELGDVVVDTGFSLEEDPGADYGNRPSRNALTLGALEVADRVVVVGAADPVGLARLVRGLVELGDRVPGTPVHVVVNRMRASLGWTEEELVLTISGFAPVASVSFLPDDQAASDRALITGRTLHESGQGPLLTALGAVVETVVPEVAVPPVRPRRWRLRALPQAAKSR